MGYKCTAPGRLQSESIPTSLLSSYLRNYNLYAVEAEQGPTEKKATISEGTIEGVVGTELQDQGLTVTLEGDTFKSSGVMSFSAESWFTDLPEGITVVAIAPANGSAIAFTFKGTPTEVSNKEIKITIPAEELKGKEAIAVEVNPNAKFNIVSGAPENYVVTVTGGSADKTEYSKGETVTITANKPAEGKRFKNWTTSDGVIFASETSATTTFTMPEKAVTVVANYEDVPKTDDKPKAETPKSEEPKADETPKTGDMNSAVVWILIAGISGLGTMYLVRKGRNA